MKREKKMASKKPTAKRKPSPPKLADTRELCLQLAAMAGLIDDKRTREKIYKAVRQLQLLDKLAVEAGLLPLKRVAGFFAKSVHETYTREEVVSVIEDMIRSPQEDDPYANWLQELRGLFPIPDKFLLADAVYTFSDRFHDGMTPQEAYNSFNEWASNAACR